MATVSVLRRDRLQIRVTPGGAALTCGCVLVLAVSLTWAFLSMRAVMAVGGSCADGGPYVSAQPCPDGAGLIGIAVPVMVLTALLGSLVAARNGAPNLLVPMWGFLFGSLGWNFLEAAWAGATVDPGFLVCGVVFELMALPAFVLVLAGIWQAVVPPDPPPSGSRWWVPAYAVLGSAGVLLGWWSYAALS